jgi:hypothetical protein
LIKPTENFIRIIIIIIIIITKTITMKYRNRRSSLIASAAARVHSACRMGCPDSHPTHAQPPD